MATDPDRLRERAETAPDSVDPKAPARTLEAAPSEAVTVGETLAALGESGSGVEAVIAVMGLLDATDAGVRSSAALALAVAVERRPDVVPEAGGLVEALCPLIEDDYHVARKHAGRALLAVARERPTAAVAAVDRVPELLDPQRPSLLEPGLGLAETAVETDPDAAADLLAPLLDALVGTRDAREEGAPVPGPDGDTTALHGAHDDRERAGMAAMRRQIRLAGVVRDLLVVRPDLVGQSLERLLAALESVGSGSVRVPLVEALGRAAESHPDAVAPAAGTLAGLLDDDPGVAANAAWALGILAEGRPREVADAAAEHVDGLATLLDDDDPGVRTASAALTAYIGEYHPDAVATATEALVERLDDEDTSVRASAALALGYSGDDVREPLRECADSDPDESVQATARTALERLADGSDSE